MKRGWSVLVVAALATSCVAPPEWRDDVPSVLQETRRNGQELCVFFALPGRVQSDRMQARIGEPCVMDALAEGSFAAVVADGVERKRLYGEWIGGGEGMGIAVLDGLGYCYAARPGPQDPEQLAAFLRKCSASRGRLQQLRGNLRGAEVSPIDQHELGCLLLDLGCRVHCEPLLIDAALAGVADAKHRLARLYALDGNLNAARRWLKASPRTPEALATEGYVRFKERRHKDAVKVFREALAGKLQGPERQRALLYLGKSLHEGKQDDEAVPILEALSAEGTGSTFEAGARHTLGHIYNPDHGHAH